MRISNMRFSKTLICAWNNWDRLKVGWYFDVFHLRPKKSFNWFVIFAFVWPVGSHVLRMSVRTPAALLKLESIEYILLHTIVTWWKIHTLKVAASKHRKMDGWNRILSFWVPAYFHGRTVSHRECKFWWMLPSMDFWPKDFLMDWHWRNGFEDPTVLTGF